ncbi:adventurous gliding motility TPR repeat lipoprotein GltE [Archangium sp.]|uniref:adventurous gliding motility TPR repeat lipoprotein GltE n=1 Tax=Archangium sp. TaxID=1872627 RepID=UPI002D5FBD1A|nr:adventurous gliding motility TPR repeat lipoprotein GltE [Archangium sp.]HYO52782.1 adventurous gliding motility TPR repeat lipoprotein GltE [Archangium sp.]
MNRTPMMRSLLLAALAVLFAAGCTGSKAAGPGTGTGTTDGKAGTGTKTNEPVPISNRAKLLFEDALGALQAQKKANAYDYPSLERKFKAALDADQSLAEAEYNLGVIAERQGNTQEAIARYQTALKKKPTLRQASENLAVITQNAGDITGAVSIYQGILKVYPDDANSRARLAEIYRQTGDHEKAMEFSRAALMREPQSVTAYKVMMRSYLERKQLAMAKLVALRALKIDQNDPELHHTIGLILLQEEKKDEARAQFKRALETRADYVPSHVMMAQLALEVEDYPAAEEHLRRILQADSKNAAAHLDLGLAYKGQGQLDKAMQEYDEAEKLDPKMAAIYFNRGVLLHRHKGAPERAIELYRKYMTLSGGEVALNAEHPIFGLLREAESIVQAQREAAAAEEQQKKLEELQKQQQELMKAEEGKQGNVAPASGTNAPAPTEPAGGAPSPAANNPPPAEAQPKQPATAHEQKNPAKTDPTEPSDDIF